MNVDAVLQPLVPRCLAALVPHHGDFDACEEALLAAACQPTRR